MKNISPIIYCSILLNEIKPFYDGNGRTSKISFANNEIMNLIDRVKKIRMMES